MTRWGSNPETLAAAATVATGVGALGFAYWQARINAKLHRLAQRQDAREEREHTLVEEAAHREQELHERATTPRLRIDGRIRDNGRHATTGQRIIDVLVSNEGQLSAVSIRLEAFAPDGERRAVASPDDGKLVAGDSGYFRFLLSPDDPLLEDGRPAWAPGVRLCATDQPTQVQAWWPSDAMIGGDQAARAAQ